MSSHLAHFSPDTSPDAEAVQVARLRAMSIADRFELLRSLILFNDQISRAGIRLRHPSVGERELGLRAAALRRGDDVVRRCYGWYPAHPGK